jgi:hypothetical protein
MINCCINALYDDDDNDDNDDDNDDNDDNDDDGGTLIRILIRST